MIRLLPALTTSLALFAASVPALAQQNLFAPRLVVNGKVISNFELNQRIAFLRLMRAPGDAQKQALDGLIDDRLRLLAAKDLAIKVTPEQITTGMEEFAGRAQLTTDQFLANLAQGGVEPQSFRDFVEAGLLWREVVRAKFGPKTQITESEVDRALASASQRNEVRVQLAELIIPAPEGGEADALALAQRLQAQISTEAGFASAARTYSAAGSAAQGGRTDWLPLANLPPVIAPLVLALGPGEVSSPMPIPGGVALFQLQGIEETQRPEATSVSVEYAQFLLPNDANAAAAAAAVRAKVDSCKDLYGLAKDLPADRLLVDTKPMGEVPGDIALELARLDPGESSAVLVHGGARVFLMLCARTPQRDEPLSRDDIRAQLQNQRFSSFADGYLQELRANAIIREP